MHALAIGFATVANWCPSLAVVFETFRADATPAALGKVIQAQAATRVVHALAIGVATVANWCPSLAVVFGTFRADATPAALGKVIQAHAACPSLAVVTHVVIPVCLQMASRYLAAKGTLLAL